MQKRDLISWRFLALIAGMVMPFELNAQAGFPDPTACLIANSELDDIYSSAIQPQCLILAGDACAKNADAGACLAALNATIEGLYTQISSALPAQLGVDEAGENQYAEALKSAQKVFVQKTECADMVGISQAACTYKAYSQQILSLIQYADQTAVWP